MLHTTTPTISSSGLPIALSSLGAFSSLHAVGVVMFFFFLFYFFFSTSSADFPRTRTIIRSSTSFFDMRTRKTDDPSFQEGHL